MIEDFMKDIAVVINKHDIDSQLNTPDFILAAYVLKCLEAYEETKKAHEKWLGR